MSDKKLKQVNAELDRTQSKEYKHITNAEKQAEASKALFDFFMGRNPSYKFNYR